MSRRWIAAATLALTLAGCSRQGPTPPEEAEPEVYNEPAAIAPPVEAPPPVVHPLPPIEENAEEPVEAPIDESAQTQDDADAVGMTTRATPRDESEEAPAADEFRSNRTGE